MANRAAGVAGTLGFQRRIHCRCVRLAAVLQHDDVFHGDHSLDHHFFQRRQQPLNVVFVVDDFDDHRQIVRHLQQLGLVDHAVGAEALATAQHGRPGELQGRGLLDDRRIEGTTFVAVGFADEDPQ